MDRLDQLAQWIHVSLTTKRESRVLGVVSESFGGGVLSLINNETREGEHQAESTSSLSRHLFSFFNRYAQTIRAWLCC
jgi:hypothetical protein